MGKLPYSSYIDGLVITKSASDTIAVSKGSCYDNTGAVVLKLSSDTTKQNESQASNATYYVYIIGNSTGSTIDILISSSSSSPSLPTGYTLSRQIGSYTTNSSGNISSISYYGVDSSSDKSVLGIIDSLSPDYSAGVSFSSGSTVSNAGYLYFYGQNVGAGYCTITIDGVNFTTQYNNDGNMADGTFVPVAKGNVVSYSARSNVSCTFYPLKGVNQ